MEILSIETAKCKHCGHLIAKFNGVWVHVRNSQLQTGWSFEQGKDGKITLGCGVDSCKCMNPEPEEQTYESSEIE